MAELGPIRYGLQSPLAALSTLEFNSDDGGMLDDGHDGRYPVGAPRRVHTRERRRYHRG